MQEEVQIAHRQATRRTRRSWFRLAVFACASLAFVTALALGLWPADRTQLVLVTSSEKSFGYIDTAGRMAIQPQWKWASEFDSEGMACVMTFANRYGWIDRTGSYVIEPVWDLAKYGYSNDAIGHSFNDKGLVAVRKEGKSGWIDRSGKAVIPIEYDHVWPFGSESGLPDLARVESLDEMTGRIVEDFADTTGRAHMQGHVHPSRPKVITNSEGDSPAPNAFGLVKFRSRQLWGWKDKSGKVVIPSQFNAVLDFNSKGLALVNNNLKWGLLDLEGNWVVEPIWTAVNEFDSREMALVREGRLWGWIDATGEYVIPPQYDEAGGFERSHEIRNLSHGDDNMAKVRKGKAWGVITRQQEIVIPIAYKYGWWDLGNGCYQLHNVVLEQTEVYNIHTGKSFPIEGEATRFDHQGHAWRSIWTSQDRFMEELIDGNGDSILSLPEGQWWPVGTPEEDMQIMSSTPIDQDVDIVYPFVEFSTRNHPLYTAQRIRPPSGLRMQYLKAIAWLKGDDPKLIPENEYLCHAYDIKGKLVWSSAWITFEVKCWIAAGCALLVAVLAHPFGRSARDEVGGSKP